MDSDTHYSCECVYFDKGYIACKICSPWCENTAKVDPKVVPIIFAKRWARNRDFKKSKKQVLTG